MDYTSMIDNYNFENEIKFLEYTIDSIGIRNYDYLNEAKFDNLKDRAKELKGKAKKVLGDLGRQFIEFINKFRKKNRLQDVTLAAVEKDIENISPNEVDDSILATNLNKVTTNIDDYSTGSSKADAKTYRADAATDYKRPSVNGSITVKVADKNKVSKILEHSKKNISDIDELDQILIKMKQNFSFDIIKKYYNKTSDTVNGAYSNKELKEIIGDGIMVEVTVNKNIPDFISKEHKYINKIEQESNKVSDVLEKRLPKTQSLIDGLNLEEYVENDNNKYERTRAEGVWMRDFNSMVNEAISKYKALFSTISEALKQVVKTKSSLIAYGKAYKAARKVNKGK